jgi:hypothetical protein
MRYRLDVVGPSIVEVVRCAGGWLFDRVMAGWDVTVLVTDDTDDTDVRPLRILGAESADLESALALAGQGPLPQAVAVAADLFGCDARIRRGVFEALHDGRIEVTFWGDTWPAELDRTVNSVQHRLSVAARAFKADALAAAAAPATAVGRTETFRTGELACRRAGTDFVPAS